MIWGFFDLVGFSWNYPLFISEFLLWYFFIFLSACLILLSVFLSTASSANSSTPSSPALFLNQGHQGGVVVGNPLLVGAASSPRPSPRIVIHQESTTSFRFPDLPADQSQYETSTDPPKDANRLGVDSEPSQVDLRALRSSYTDSATCAWDNWPTDSPDQIEIYRSVPQIPPPRIITCLQKQLQPAKDVLCQNCPSHTIQIYSMC